MSNALVACRAQVGLDALPVQVEVHLGAGLPCFQIVGLLATEVKESRERVRAAFANSGFEWPAGRITVNLAPAELPKDGGRFDLAVAVGILSAAGVVPDAAQARFEFFGELGLDGSLRAVSGALPALRAACAAGRQVVLPSGNVAELAPWPDAAAWVAPSLAALVAHLRGQASLPSLGQAVAECTAAAAVELPGRGPLHGAATAAGLLDDVCGQRLGKRAMVVAAAGGHSVLMSGPPGCGKTMLAQRLRGLLPPLTPDEHVEVAIVASVAGVQAQSVRLGAASAASPAPLLRPFRAPHHSASAGALIGGGAGVRPGEVTLAHCGVLFLDELPEFNRNVLEALREPLEGGSVTVSRASRRAEYPARFQLVAAMNPCACGYYGDAQHACRCSPRQRQQYRARISGPLLDRIDLRVDLQSVTDAELAMHRAAPRDAAAESALRERVAAARRVQWQRSGALNAMLDGPQLEACARLSRPAERLLREAHRSLGLSMRALTRARRTARTIADLEGCEDLDAPHVAEAIQLRRGCAG